MFTKRFFPFWHRMMYFDPFALWFHYKKINNLKHFSDSEILMVIFGTYIKSLSWVLLKLMNNHQFQRVTWRGRECKSDYEIYIIQYFFLIKIFYLFFSKNCKISQMKRWLGHMWERERENIVLVPSNVTKNK